ncbi:MAG: hypothetical protein P8Z35_26690 [Ignavibacteriaceae bacterium]
MLILVYVSNELSYESVHKNRKNIYRISVGFGSSDAMMKLAGAMPGVGPAAVQEIPEVKEAVRFRVDRKAKITVDDQNFTESNFFFADSNVFNVFTFPMLIGNQETDLNSP